MQEKVVQTIQEVDFSGVMVPTIAVYKSPEDYPGYFVARVYHGNKPTNTVMIKKTLTEIENDIRKNRGMTFFPRTKEDVASLVGVWI